MKKSNKQFDAVDMMRAIRDRLGKKCAHMSYEEQKKYIRQHITKKSRKRETTPAA